MKKLNIGDAKISEIDTPASIFWDSWVAELPDERREAMQDLCQRKNGVRKIKDDRTSST